MFSRALASLNYFRTTPTPEPPTTQKEEVPASQLPEMVTTRQRSGDKVVAIFNDEGEAIVEGVNLDDIPAELLSPETRKRRREAALAAAGETVNTDGPGEKRRKLPVRGKEEGDVSVEHTHWEQEIPIEEINEEAIYEKAEETPEVAGINTNDDLDHEKETTNEPENKTSLNEVPETQEFDAEVLTQSESITEPLPSNELDPNEVIPTVSNQTEPTPSTHTKLSDSINRSSHPTTNITSISPPNPSIQEIQDPEDLDSDSDSDAAPEEVGLKAAQEEVLSQARDIAKTTEAQATLQRQKRAAAQEAQRKARAEGSAAAAASKKRKAAALAAESGDEIGEEDIEATTNNSTEFSKDPTKKQKITKANIPAYLPAEYLEDDDDQDLATNHTVAGSNLGPQAKKIKFSDVEAQIKKRNRRDRPKDVVGKDGTRYRVAEKVNELLPPRASVVSKGVKERWLEGRVGRGGGVVKKSGGRGFFVR